MSDSKSSVLDDALAVAAHELKTPIQSVMGFLDLLQHSGDLNERQQYYHNRAANGLQEMYDLVVSLLDMTRLEGDTPFDLLTCDVKSIIQEAINRVEGIAHQRGITLHHEVDSELDDVLGDVNQLGQVLNNLLSNAVKYNHEQGHIWITAINQPGMIRVSVRDSGPGIPPGEQVRVFDRFFRSKRHSGAKIEGAGLGLAITKAIVEKHQGRIWVESTPDAGTTFIFTLPRKPQIQDGGHLSDETRQHMGEGRDNRFNIKHESPIEASDDVDDNTQEAPGSAESDSSSDLV